jgi:hypothetical protein
MQGFDEQIELDEREALGKDYEQQIKKRPLIETASRRSIFLSQGPQKVIEEVPEGDERKFLKFPPNNKNSALLTGRTTNRSG